MTGAVDVELPKKSACPGTIVVGTPVTDATGEFPESEASDT